MRTSRDFSGIKSAFSGCWNYRERCLGYRKVWGRRSGEEHVECLIRAVWQWDAFEFISAIKEKVREALYDAFEGHTGHTALLRTTLFLRSVQMHSPLPESFHKARMPMRYPCRF